MTTDLQPGDLLPALNGFTRKGLLELREDTQRRSSPATEAGLKHREALIEAIRIKLERTPS